MKIDIIFRSFSGYQVGFSHQHNEDNKNRELSESINYQDI